ATQRIFVGRTNPRGIRRSDREKVSLARIRRFESDSVTTSLCDVHNQPQAGGYNVCLVSAHAGAVHRAYFAVNFLATIRFPENRLRIILLSLFHIRAARQ